MKRCLSAIMVIVLLLTCVTLPAHAETWKCPNCSRSNSDKFCPDCGAKKPEPVKCNGCGYKPDSGDNFRFCPQCGLEFGKPKVTPTPKPTPTPKKTPTPTPRKTPTPTPKPSRTFQIDSARLNSDGTVTVKWTDTASKGPYQVGFVYYVNGNYNSDEQLKQRTWIERESTYLKSIDMIYPVPGQWYWIVVTDADGNMARYAYRPNLAKNFSEFSVKITMNLKQGKGSSLKKVNYFSADDITRKTKYTFGAEIRLDHSQLKKERHYKAHVAITAPDGSLLSIDHWDDFSLPAGRSYTRWNMYAFDKAFESAQKIFGEIPRGEYTWSLYFDGKFVNSHKFRVRQ